MTSGGTAQRFAGGALSIWHGTLNLVAGSEKGSLIAAGGAAGCSPVLEVWCHNGVPICEQGGPHALPPRRVGFDETTVQLTALTTPFHYRLRMGEKVRDEDDHGQRGLDVPSRLGALSCHSGRPIRASRGRGPPRRGPPPRRDDHSDAAAAGSQAISAPAAELARS
jgi:hypothetical protein